MSCWLVICICMPYNHITVEVDILPSWQPSKYCGLADITQYLWSSSLMVISLLETLYFLFLGVCEHWDVREHPHIRVHHLLCRTQAGWEKLLQQRHIPVLLQPGEWSICLHQVRRMLLLVTSSTVSSTGLTLPPPSTISWSPLPSLPLSGLCPAAFWSPAIRYRIVGL